MIKVVHVITGLGSGGAERMLARVATAGDRRRFEHVVVSLTDEGMYGPELRSESVEVIALGMKRRPSDIVGLFRLVRILRDHRPDVVQTWLYHADLVGLIASKLAGVPVVGWNIRCSNMELQNYSAVTRAIRKVLTLLSRFVTFAVVNSAAGRDFHQRLGYRPPRWELIWNGFDASEFRPDPQARAAIRRELRVGDSTAVIGMIARFDPMKDHATFLQAAGELASHGRDVHFVLAGSEVSRSNDALRALVASHGLAERAHLLGFRADVQRILAACDLIVLSSAFGEGFPNVLGEAMSCGVPCVATDVGDSAYVIGDTGRVVPPRDPSSIARACRELLDMTRDHRMALGRGARERIERHFDVRSIVARYEAMYDALARTPGPIGDESHAS